MNRRGYEVTAAGFDGGTDATDDRVFWVAADTEVEVAQAIKGTGATLWGLSNTCGISDFTLPADAEKLRDVLEGFQT